jgi:DNA-binding transcriptional MerR regulator
MTPDPIGTHVAADILGVSTRTVRRQAKSGLLPVQFKIDGDLGSYVFDRADILRIRDERDAAESAS